MAVYRQDRRRRLTLVLLVITSLALITLDEQGLGWSSHAAVGGAGRGLAAAGRGRRRDLARHRLLRQPRARRRAPGRERAAAPPDRRGRRARSPRTRRRSPTRQALKDLADLPDIDDYDSVFASVVDGVASATSSARSRSTGAPTRHREGMPVVVGARRRRARRQGHVGRRRRAAPCSASTTAASVSAPSSSTRAAARATRHRDGAARQRVPRPPASARPRSKLVKGDFATTSAPVSRRSRPGSRSARSCASVDPSTATAAHARCVPIVDLDALTFVKVLAISPR